MLKYGWSLLMGLALLSGCARGPLPGAPATHAMRASEADSGVLVRVYPHSAHQIDRLAMAGMDIFTVKANHVVEGLAEPAQLALLKAWGVPYTLMLREQENMWAKRFPAGYMTTEQLTERLKGLAERHANLAKLHDLGDSWEKQAGKADRDVWALEITGTGPAKDKPAVLFTAGHHARELAPVEVATRLAEHLLESYGRDERVTRLVDTRHIWIVPMMNPDGRVAVEGGNAMWRKNRHPFAKAIGVDLNRNYDAYWEKGDDNPRQDTYHGEKAFSEPESRALEALFAKRRFATAMDYHAYGGAIIWPPGYSRDLAPDDAAFRTLGKAMSKYNGYRADTIARTFYLSYGDVASWAYLKHRTLAFGIEMGNQFAPPYSEVAKLWEHNREPALLLIEAAGKAL